MKIYSRTEKIREGRRLVQQDAIRHRDLGGGMGWNQHGIGSFVSNPYFGISPTQGRMQVPPLAGPGGYTNSVGAGTQPGEFMAAQQMAQQPHAHGGSVDFNGETHGGAIDENAYRNACELLEQAKRACGGPVARASGGRVGSDIMLSHDAVVMRGKDYHPAPTIAETAKGILDLWTKIERQSPNVSQDKHFSYLCQRSPGARRFWKKLLDEGHTTRSGCAATMRGALTRWANGWEPVVDG